MLKVAITIHTREKKVIKNKHNSHLIDSTFLLVFTSKAVVSGIPHPWLAYDYTDVLMKTSSV